jgi:hypothetical protein
MVAEVYAGLSAFKAMFDMAKGLKDINDAAIRNGAIIELQEQILSAQGQQSALIERIQALETEVAFFERWDGEKQRYELKQLGHHGVFAYLLKKSEQAIEPAHWICPDCYEKHRKSILQQVSRMPGRADVRVCQTCDWEAYVTGPWQPEHGGITPTYNQPRR